MATSSSGMTPATRCAAGWRSMKADQESFGMAIQRRSQGGHSEGSAMAYVEGPRPESWRDRLWLRMTVAGVLLLVCAALAV
jgi:hypothetical protein